uniref:FAD/NAD(P)-binding domain-containing protein n=1 Tax=Pyrodinium bahamense TaxID=73915 RepID=A0A7S0ATV8_9DINO|mmetsp:Transcript_41814/g.116619  ORF Transcript_41814/g.116619 Transcript_41814/m.116619 type:complete len:699 (+) Transcript_41814:71-2167(+)
MALRPRTPSPTRVLWENRRQAQKVMMNMAQHGLHIFSPEWSGYHSASFTECTLQVYGSTEVITLPVQVCTKVQDVKNVIGYKAQVNPEDLVFIVKQGCSWVVQSNHAEVGRKIFVRGLRSFQPQKMQWPHPIGFLGAGYNGIKNALLWVHQESSNFVMFDRYDRVGGHAWLTQANKTSKLQTEMAAFHVWFGNPWDDSNDRLGFPTDWETWPKRDQIIAHLQHAAERYGILPYIHFSCDVVQADTVGAEKDFWRSYDLSVQPLGTNQQPFHCQVSAVFQWPCAYFARRNIEYPGEENFDGQVGYGMNDDIPFDTLEGSRTAILGNGAFAVENIRTCCEYGVEKVYLVTRRKNLPSPRLTCWFAHQALIPVPASMILNSMVECFQKCGFGDPWEYHSVYASKDRTHCTIISNSRFGIGDVTFLAVAWGRCEYVVDLLKRCTRHTLHLESGRRLDNVTNIIKALGLIADWSCDRLHKIKTMIGTWPNGDWRRFIFCDPLGMHAANFTTFSTGIGSYTQSVKDKFALDYPGDIEAMIAGGIADMLPTNKADLNRDRPAHQYDAKYQMTVAMVVEGSCPRMSATCAGVEDYMHQLYLAVNPLDRFYEECKQSWDQYQEDWWKMGFEHEYVPYPTSKESVLSWFDEYRRTVGPTTMAEKQAMMEMSQEAEGFKWDTSSALDWWKENCQGGWQVKSRGLGGGGG